MPCKGCQQRRAALLRGAKALKITGQQAMTRARSLSAGAKAFAARLKHEPRQKR